MQIAMPDWTALLLFAAALLCVTLYGLAVATHFPAAQRTGALAGRGGGWIIRATIVTAGLAAAIAVIAALRHLPGYAAVLAGCAAILVAPLLLKPLPDTFIDGAGGLIVFSAAGLLLALIAL